MKKMIKRTSALAISAFMLAQYIPFSAIAATDSSHCDLNIHPFYLNTDQYNDAKTANYATGTTADAGHLPTGITVENNEADITFTLVEVNADRTVKTGGYTVTTPAKTFTSVPDGYYKIIPSNTNTDSNVIEMETMYIQLPVQGTGGSNIRTVDIYPKFTDNSNTPGDIHDPEEPSDPEDPTSTDKHAIKLKKLLSDSPATPGWTATHDPTSTTDFYAAFTAYYKDNYDNWVAMTSTYYTDANGEIIIDGLPLGTYYLVETTAPKGYMLDQTPVQFIVDGTTTTNTIKEVTNEKVLGVTKTIADDASGNTYNWTITGSVPADKSKLSNYVITDTYSNLTITGVSVNIDGITKIADAAAFDTTGTVKQFKAVDNGSGTLTISFSQAAINAFPSTGLVVTVSSTIAGSGDATNNASITYSYGATSTGPVIPTTPDPVNYPTGVDPITSGDDVTPATLIISNVNDNHELGGATYKIEKADGTPISDALNSIGDAAHDAATNPDKVTVANLAPGAYKITQIGVDSDHIVNDTPRLIYVSDTGVIYESDKTTVVADGSVANQVQFVNTPKTAGFNLPFTGTTATIIFTVTGLILMAGTLFFIIILKKRDDDDEEEQENN